MKRLAFALLALALLRVTPAFAAEVQVIANPSVTADLTASELKEIFLGAKTSVGGASVQPVLADGGAAHEEFLKTYVGKNDQALRTHFKSLVFTGKGVMPKSFPSDEAMVKYIASTKGAIGYISAGADAAGVKKIQVK